MVTTPTKKKKHGYILENLIIGLQVLYVFNTHVKFCANRMLFSIWSIKYFLCIILEYKKLNLSIWLMR